MRIMRIVLIILSILLCGTALGADYYVDATLGNDGAAGTIGAPWKTIEKVNDFAEATGFANGDTVNFKRGETWSNDETLGFDGSFINFRGVNGLTLQDYGTGAKPRLNANTQQPIFIETGSLSNLTIRNLDCSGMDAMSSGRSHIELDGFSGLVIDGVEINGHTGATAYPYMDTLLNIYDIDGNIEIKNCVLQNAVRDTWANTVSGWGAKDVNLIRIKYWDNDLPKTAGTVSVHDNILHDVYADCMIINSIRTTTNIYNNTMTHYGENAIDLKSCAYFNIYNNQFSRGGYGLGGSGGGQSAIGTHATNDSVDMPLDDIIIRDNTFYDSDYRGIRLAGSPNTLIYGNIFTDVYNPISISRSEGTKIYNNVIVGREDLAVTNSIYRSAITILGNSQDDVEVYSNSIYLSASSYDYGIYFQPLAGRTGMVIRNNIVHTTQASANWPLYVHDTTSSDLSVTDNCWYNSGQINRVNYKTTIYDNTKQTDWRIFTSGLGVFSDPLFADPENNDLSLQGGTPCTGWGAPISADTTAPVVTITTSDPSNITVDSLALAGYATDTVGEVTTCKYRFGSEPDESNGTSLTLLESFPESFDELIAGFSEGANTLYVGCDDNDDNWGSDSIVVNYTIVSADGCSQSEVQAAIDAIDEDGDVVTIPACDPNPAVWTTGVDSSTSFEFAIQGASEALTQIKYTGSGNVFDFTSPANDDNGFRGISNLTVMGNTVSGVYDGADNNTTTYIDEAGRDLSALGMGTGSFVYNSTDGCLGAVAAGGFSTTASTNDTVTFSTISGGTDGDFDDGDTVLLYLSRSGSETFLKAYTDSGNPELYIHDVTVGAFHTVGRIVGYHGVISDNTFTRPAWASAYGFYIEESSSYGWPLSDPSLGTRSSLFVEDNTFQGYCHAVSGFCGSRYVFRHNTRNEDARAGSGCGIDTHEGGYNTCWPTTTPELRHGGRLWEVYNNTFISGDVDEHNGLYQRSGIGLLTGNTFTNHHIGVTVLIDGNSRGPDCDITENCPVVNYVTATDCSDPGEGCCEPPTNVWIWGNTYNDVAIETQILPYNSCLSLDAANGPAVYDETPESVRDGFTWTPFTYPHPLRGLVGETKLSRTTLLRTSLGE